MSIDINQIKVTVKIGSKPPLLATASLFICDELTINGFRVKESPYLDKDVEEKVWIEEPKYGPKYQSLVFFKDKTLWAEIKRKIYSEYINELGNEDLYQAFEKDQKSEFPNALKRDSN